MYKKKEWYEMGFFWVFFLGGGGGEFLQGQGNCPPNPLRQAPDDIIPNLQLRRS